MDKNWILVMGFAAGIGAGMLLNIYRQVILSRGAKNRFEEWMQKPSYMVDLTLVILGVLIVKYFIQIVFSVFVN